MRVLVTGANGFLGKNLLVHLRERGIEPLTYTREMSVDQLRDCISGVDFIFHLAGVNRPRAPDDFAAGNSELTDALCELMRSSGRQIPVVFASSIQADLDNPYGTSKKAAEESLRRLQREVGSPVYIYRLPNVFGKWSRPNYNSVVATFCYNVVNGLPIQINDPSTTVCLVYVDDLVTEFIRIMDERPSGLHMRDCGPLYSISVGDLATRILAFKASRDSRVTEAVGAGLTRALYSTYLSFLSPSQFTYSLQVHEESRGRFVEMLKTKDSGQFSFLTAHPGITRGGHYHHSKNEKFLVIQGRARFSFRHVITGETYELFTDGAKPEVVETVPGWAHDITNVSSTELIVMLWANEIYDPHNPDTIKHRV